MCFFAFKNFLSLQNSMLFHNFAVQLYNMKRIFLWLSGAMLLLASCNQYNNVMKTADYDYKYEAAKEYFVKGQYSPFVRIVGGACHFDERDFAWGRMPLYVGDVGVL